MYSDDDTHRWVGCPIRISTDQSLLAAPHGFSQRATSFVASWCQGIHRMPFSRSIAPHAQKPATATRRAGPPANKTIRARTTLDTYTLNASGRPRDARRRAKADKPLPAGSDQPASRHVQKRTNLFTCPKNTKIPDHQHNTDANAPRAVPGSDRIPPVMMPRRPTPSPLVEADGIEPTTPCLQSRCSPS